MCPMLDSDLNDAGVFQLMPDGLYNGRVCKVNLTKSKSQVEREKQEGKTLPINMATLDWKIFGGDFDGREIRYNNVMLGGLTAEGKPQPLGALCSLLHHAGLPWTCKKCKTNFSGPKQFYIATKEDKESGLKIGNYYCAACKNPEPGILWDTDVLMGASCGLSVGHRKQEGTSKEFNEVKGYVDLQ